VFDIAASAAAWHDGWNGQHTIAGADPLISLTLVPAASPLQAPRLSRSGTALIDLHFPTERPGLALRCRIDTGSRNLSRLRRGIHRGANHRSSAWAIAGMVILLAVCGWIVAGAEGARRALSTGGPRWDFLPLSRETMDRWFGARLLRAAELPGLFAIMADVCRRARLRRLPDLYYIPARADMNAYALGGPDGAAIVLTEGLLRGMPPAEIAGILAHEIAHICNNDAWAMSWAATLRHAIEWTAATGLAAMQNHAGGRIANAPLQAVLSAAPAIGELLALALCRIRELDADATALELTGDLPGLIAALDKLERHHTGLPAMAATVEDGLQLLRSHPATFERVGTLLALAH
jgi:heat shock protein HtpX